MSDFNKNKNDLDGFNDLDNVYATITMFDDDGEEKEFLIISSVEDKGTNYLLVMESDSIDDDEAEATILKEIREDGENAFYSVVEDDAEFERAVGFFQNSNEDYDIEI